ncbi:MAG: cupin domain-containing protein [Alphaproteobacteria bacterium]|nr:cupin domain-containing protein [Alphaproteobacteria bacterium]
MDIEIGDVLRGLRERAGLSQRALAQKVGLSAPAISMIESGRTSPSVGTLKRVLDGLDISLADFFAREIPVETEHFYRARELTEIGEKGISYRQVGRNLKQRPLQILHERYQAGSDTGRNHLSHDGFEGGVVVRGRLEVTVDGRKRVLGPGDAYYFDSRLPHRFRNAGKEECEVVSACTPPSF